ncbi:MAG: ion transporter, partial [Candidatus Eremiobacterota bacterium]
MTERTETLNSITSEARNPDMEAIASNMLEVMLQDLEESKKKTARKMEERARLLHEARKQGQIALMEALGDEILSLQDRFNKIREEIPHIQDALLERRLEERILKTLGSKRNVLLLEYTVILFTMATLVIIGLEIFFNLSRNTRHILDIIDTVICAVFLCEFFWRMYFADSRWWYFKRNWILFIASLPLIGLVHITEFLQFGQGIRIFRLARSLRLLRGITFFSRSFKTIGTSTGLYTGQSFVLSLITVSMGQILTNNQLKRIIRLSFLILMMIFFGTIFIGYVCDDGNSNIVGPYQSVWWSFTTVITGGFANIYNPQHASERFITIVMVIAGMILSGALIGNLTSMFLEDNTGRIEEEHEKIELHVDEISEKLNI